MARDLYAIISDRKEGPFDPPFRREGSDDAFLQLVIQPIYSVIHNVSTQMSYIAFLAKCSLLCSCHSMFIWCERKLQWVRKVLWATQSGETMMIWMNTFGKLLLTLNCSFVLYLWIGSKESFLTGQCLCYKPPYFQVEEMLQTTRMANESSLWLFWGSYKN
jgi:hypothetical protein